MATSPIPADPTRLRPHYDWVVLGSGIGGAWAASRLAAAGHSVALLEAAGELGGNSGRYAEAQAPDVFDHAAWPSALRADLTGLAAAQSRVATIIATVSDESQVVAELLSDAAAHGAHLIVNAPARGLSASSRGGWDLTFDLNNLGREAYAPPALRITANNVVVAMGGATARWLKSAGLSQASGLQGGCANAVDGRSGGTDDAARVFMGDGRETVPRLFVAGRAVWPAEVPGCSLGALLVLMERNLGVWLGGAVAAGPLLPAPRPAVGVGLLFTEAMRGFVSARVTTDGAYAAGFTCGKDEGSRLDFVLTLSTESVEAMVRDPQHPAKSVGTVVAPALDPQPLMVAGGDFNLFVDQADRSRRMKYRMALVSASGRRFFFDGFKAIRDDPGIDVWPDTTTLYVTIYDGDDDTAAVWGRGILHILTADFARQLATFKTFGARNPWQAARAQVAFARLFLGTLFDSYVGAAPFLPDARKPGSLPKIAAATLGWTFFAVAACMFWVWPWRSPMMRNQPQLAPHTSPAGSSARHTSALASLASFPSLMAHRKAAAATEEMQSTYHCSWVPDNLVQTHGGLGDVPFHPSDVMRFNEPSLRRGFINLTRIRDAEGRVVAIGSQLETIIANTAAVARKSIDAYTDWTLLFPGKGVLFLGQVEGGPDLAQLSNQVAKTKQPWKGERAFNRSLGPLPDDRGIVHAGTGIYRNTIGSFREFNIVKEVPVHGDIVADTRYEVHLRDAPPEPHDPLAVARGLQLPPSCSHKLNANLAWHVVKRHMSVDAARDIVYSTAGLALQPAPVPASLGPLSDEALSHTRVLLAKLRDEHGAVVGLAAASSWQAAEGAGYLSQWTLLISGVGTLYVAPDEDENAQPPARGYFGDRRGLILGGTGDFFEATGVVQERWPAGAGPIHFDIDIVTNRL